MCLFLNLPQRERKRNYDVNAYFHDALTGKSGSEAAAAMRKARKGTLYHAVEWIYAGKDGSGINKWIYKHFVFYSHEPKEFKEGEVKGAIRSVSMVKGANFQKPQSDHQ